MGVWYRPGDFAMDVFCDDFEDLAGSLMQDYDNLICAGDFNINFLDLNSCNTIKLNNIISSYSLSQIVTEPTRKMSLLDLFFVSDHLQADSCVVHTPDISDHDMILMDIYVSRSVARPNFSRFRNFGLLDLDLFYTHLCSTSFNDIFFVNDINIKVEIFTSYLLLLFDIHVPEKKVMFRRHQAPWLTDNIRSIMRLRDRTYSEYKRTGLPDKFAYYKSLRNEVNAAINREKRAFLEHHLKTGTCSDGSLWKKLKILGIEGRPATAGLPDSFNTPSIINQHFVTAHQTDADPGFDILDFFLNHRFAEHLRFNFEYVDEDTIYNELLLIKSNAVGTDNLNIKMLLYSCPFILPYLTHIVNYVIECGTFPLQWKSALVTALPKCKNPSGLNDLRPISILCVLSKLTERIMNLQLKSYFEKNNLLPDNQSGFRKNHSCSTALLQVTDEILKATDSDKVTVLVLLDYSKAFDRINHKLLLGILSYYGVSEDAGRLLSSFLIGRSQRVKLNNEISDPLQIISGVPQGSVISPLLFSIYVSMLTSNLKFCRAHCYADDTQVYYTFDATNLDAACEAVNSDLNLLVDLSKQYCLTINPSKSKAMLFGRKVRIETLRSQLNIQMEGKKLQVVTVARSLGLEMDVNFNFETHISKCMKKAFSSLKLIYASKNFLNFRFRTILCESLVLSHFNYADSVYGPCITKAVQGRIQRIQNACIRLICGIRKYDHISHKYAELKWLKMHERRFLHACCLFHNIIISKSPPYLFEKISYRTDVHNINIRKKNLLSIPQHKSRQFRSSFSYTVANFYNRIPDSLKRLNLTAFKYGLRAHLLDSTIHVS